ncbi:MAG: MBL fold metallo-hydrolase [Pirellulales bacterium]
MKLVMLGTTGYHPNDLRDTACYMLPEIGVVFDAGTGMHRLRSVLTTDELDIFLSHAHLDHVVGLTFLLGALYDKQMRRVTVHGDGAKLAAIREHLFSAELFPVVPTFEMRPLDLQKPRPIEVASGGQVTYFPLEHPGGSIGFRLEAAGRSLAYVTDTTART